MSSSPNSPSHGTNRKTVGDLEWNVRSQDDSDMGAPGAPIISADSNDDNSTVVDLNDAAPERLSPKESASAIIASRSSSDETAERGLGSGSAHSILSEVDANGNISPIRWSRKKNVAASSSGSGSGISPVRPKSSLRQTQVDSTISTKPSHKSRVLGRKVVSAAKRPMRAVGRKLARKSGNVKSAGLSVATESGLPNLANETPPSISNANQPASSSYTAQLPARDNSSSRLVAIPQQEHLSAREVSVPSPSDHHSEWAVHFMERILRHVLLFCFAFCLGVKYPMYLVPVLRLTEFTATGYATCLVIFILAYLQKTFNPATSESQSSLERRMMFQSRSMESSRSVFSSKSQSRLEAQQPTHDGADEMIPLLHQDTMGTTNRSIDYQTMPETRRAEQRELPGEPKLSPVPTNYKLEHPSLNVLYIMDVVSGKRIPCNLNTPFRLSNEWFDMDVMILIRTPNVDDPAAPKGTEANQTVSSYITGKQRRFEFQYQIKLKKTPEGKQVYFGCEIEEPIKMGLVQRAFVGAAMAFMKSTNPTFHYSITGSKHQPKDGNFEKPHMCFTVEGSLDRLVVTPAGQTPPKLGSAIEEDAESIKRRKKGHPIDWNTKDTYTMALWTSYVDFLDWRVINLPGIRPFGLSSVLGARSMNCVMYLIDKAKMNDDHNRNVIEPIIDWEISNNQHAEQGPVASGWTADQNRSKTVRPVSPPVGLSEIRLSDFDFETELPDEDEDDDAETAAELGEGLYLRSGDHVCLQDLPFTDDIPDVSSCCVSDGGGFAVLQDQEACIVVEKARRSGRSRLIKSGDTVMFKMIEKRGDGSDIKYLTIHRGWWLKWVSSVPSKNGFFTIHSRESEFSDKDDQRSAGTQTAFLTMGESFTLRHKRWSNYHVGVAAEPSPTYGGRMLGLYNPKAKSSGTMSAASSSDFDCPSDDNGDERPPLAPNSGWMEPLLLCAVESSTLHPKSPKDPPLLPEADMLVAENLDLGRKKMLFSPDHSHCDVPAWIEMMDRRKRVRQLTYVVRVHHRKPTNKISEEDNDGTPDTFLRLRTGRELAPILRVGQSMKMSMFDERTTNHSTLIGDGKGLFRPSGSDLSQLHDPTNLEINPDSAFSFDDEVVESEEESIASYIDITNDDEEMDPDDMQEEGTPSQELNLATMSEADDELDFAESDSDTDAAEEDTEYDGSGTKKKGAVKRGKAIIGKGAKMAKRAAVGTGKLTAKTVVGTTKLTAKTVVGTGKLTKKTVVGTGKLTKKTVVGTGKLTAKAAKGTTKAAVRGGKKVAKGTVSMGKNVTVKAGKAVIAPIQRKSKKPPKKEPKSKLKEKNIAVSKRMKRLGKREAKSGLPFFVAGELCAPEQSCRTASHVLTRMSNVPYLSREWKKTNDALSEGIEQENDQDRWFLEGTAVQLGVSPDPAKGALVYESVAARCHTESHWREEWCGIYGKCLSFYSPLTKTPCLELAYMDITSVRALDCREHSPLPGFSLLVLETAWYCHYVAFRDDEARDTFGEQVEGAIASHMKTQEEYSLREARFWQGFQSLSKDSLSLGFGKWAKVSLKDKRRGERSILNGRRMDFDCEDNLFPSLSEGILFVEELLSQGLSFSLESLQNDPESFVNWLNLTSNLKLLPLSELDLTSPEAFCLFTNIYHCLLQQTMLMNLDGPIQKKNMLQLMRTSCYEVGGDIFSLAELHCCVLRGKLSRPLNPKPPYVEAPRKSNPYSFYTVAYVDPRANFILNTGDLACPRAVPVLRPESLEHQMNHVVALFLQQELKLDVRKRSVTIPKLCEIFRNDFGGDSKGGLKFCLQSLDDEVTRKIKEMAMDTRGVVVKYAHTSDYYHTVLSLLDDSNESKVNI